MQIDGSVPDGGFMQGRELHHARPQRTADAVLESHVRTEIIAQGYDPTIGYLHTHQKDRAALVFDLMEPLRPIVDRTVLEFVQSQTFERTDFTI
jgi:CRISPR-associated protein Cas1